MPPQPRYYRHKKAKEASSSVLPPATPFRVMRNIVHTTQLYKDQIPTAIQEEIVEVEEDARVTRICTTDEEVRKEFEALLPDPGYPRGHVALYMKTFDLAWQQKFLMGTALIERSEAHQAILLQLDVITMNLQKIASHLGINLDFGTEAPSGPGIKQESD